MNKIVNKFLLIGDEFMSEVHVRQTGFICRACRPLTKHCERIQKFKQTGNLNYI